MQFTTFVLIGFIFFSGLACQSSSEQTAEASSPPAATSDSTTTSEKTDKPTILFFGNSLTAGYGLDPSEAFSAVIERRLDSLGLDYQVVNAGLSGETTASGNTRLDWVLDRQPVDIFVLELGANDGLRGISPEETRRNLNAMIDKVQETYPEAKIILSGMMVPPNMGPEYAESFQQIFPEIAEAQNVALIPFLLEDVAGEPELNLPDGIHPTAEGHRMVADNVWDVLYPLLESES